ncbi:MAG: cation transporter [Spirochaetes bacterium]|nr:cation transporter [Spirochaetota bacterium]
MNRQKKKVMTATLSVASNATLVVLKLVVGTVIGSISVISEAIHSGVDLVAALIALFAVKTSGKPADRGHRYGHGKIENIAGTTEALLIFLAAGWIIYEAVRKLMNPQPMMEEVSWGVAVMAGSALMNLAVSHMLFKVGRETDSIALKADAWHLRTDVYTSLGVMGGLLLYWIGHRLFPGVNLQWIDPAAAIAVALLIVKAAYDLTVQSVRDLMDASLPAREERVLMDAAMELIPQVRSVHHLKTRKSGPYRFFDYHLAVDPEMTARDSHALGDAIEAKVLERFPDARVTCHVEPCDRTCDRHCRAHCFVAEEK